MRLVRQLSMHADSFLIIEENLPHIVKRSGNTHEVKTTPLSIDHCMARGARGLMHI